MEADFLWGKKKCYSQLIKGTLQIRIKCYSGRNNEGGKMMLHFKNKQKKFLLKLIFFKKLHIL